nr:protein CTR9 homolog [Tanacetum cinerariifolium]
MSSSTTSNNNEILKQRTYHQPSGGSKLDSIPSKKIQSLSFHKWDLLKLPNDTQVWLKIFDALEVNDKNPDALCMLGHLELKNDDWIKAKDTFRATKDAFNEKYSYVTLCLENWNYFAAVRKEHPSWKRRISKIKGIIHKEHPANMYVANGAGVVLAEKVQEAASESVFVQMLDVWINLAHAHFTQGNFSLAIKMYQNCLRKFYYNTDNQILLYLARTHYEVEQRHDCKKTILKAIHFPPSI